jgi:putative sigma-54 modulation protein
MIINVRAKKVKITKLLSEYIKEKLSKSQKFFSDINKIEIFLSGQKYLYIAEVIINIFGRTIRIKQQAADLRSAVDIAISKVEQQLRKEKEKIKEHRKSFRYDLGFAEKYLQQTEKVSLSLEKRKFVPDVSSIDEVVEIMDDNDYTFWIFINGDTKKLTVIHRKLNSNYGLMEIDKRR